MQDQSDSCSFINRGSDGGELILRKYLGRINEKGKNTAFRDPGGSTRLELLIEKR